MIEFLWHYISLFLGLISGFFQSGYDLVWDTVDIVLVFVAVYWLILLIRGTRAVQILAGVIALIGIRLLADVVQLTTILWILDNFLAYGVLIVIILFQADIRRALARVGRGMFLRSKEQEESQAVEEVVRSVQILSGRLTGALIVIERETRLEDLVEAGVPIDAVLTKELLTSLFYSSSALHDGAVLLKDGRITHAGCILPLTQKTDLPEGSGTRHRAALGLTEEADAVVIVVSEETGAISLVNAGELTRGLEPPELRERLREILSRSQEPIYEGSEGRE